MSSLSADIYEKPGWACLLWEIGFTDLQGVLYVVLFKRKSWYYYSDSESGSELESLTVTRAGLQAWLQLSGVPIPLLADGKTPSKSPKAESSLTIIVFVCALLVVYDISLQALS